MDHHHAILSQFEPDDLQHDPGQIRANRQHPRRIGVWFEIDDDDCVINCMLDGADIDAVLER